MKGKPPRKRKPPTQLILSDEFKQHMEARMKSEESKRALNELAGLIIEWAVAQMPVDLLQGLVKEKGHATVKSLWPDIVNAYFKALSNPAPARLKNGVHRAVETS